MRDYRNRDVSLTDAGLDHIRQRHPDMMDKIAAIREAIENPVMVTRSRLLARGENFYGSFRDRLYVKVYVLYRPSPAGWIGEIQTAHLVSRIEPKEEILWQ